MCNLLVSVIYYPCSLGNLKEKTSAKQFPHVWGFFNKTNMEISLPLAACASRTGSCLPYSKFIVFSFCLSIVNKVNTYLKIGIIIAVRWSWTLTDVWCCPLPLFSTSPAEKTAKSTYLSLDMYQCLRNQPFSLRSSCGVSILAAELGWGASSTASLKKFFDKQKLVSVGFCTKAITVKNCGIAFWFCFGFLCPKLVFLEAKYKQIKKTETEIK